MQLTDCDYDFQGESFQERSRRGTNQTQKAQLKIKNTSFIIQSTSFSVCLIKNKNRLAHQNDKKSAFFKDFQLKWIS
jgi:hypothetical protein